MRVYSIQNTSFKSNFKLSQDVISIIERDTRLSYYELVHMPLEQAGELMKQRQAQAEQQTKQNPIRKIFKKITYLWKNP